jgi:CAAX protease family protein
MLTFCYDAIITSFSEEFFFRGIIQNYISRKLTPIKDGNIFAIIISAIIFALFHFPFTEVTAFSGVFIFGIIIGWLYDKTHNLWPPIFMHGIQDLVFLSSAVTLQHFY